MVRFPTVVKHILNHSIPTFFQIQLQAICCTVHILLFMILGTCWIPISFKLCVRGHYNLRILIVLHHYYEQLSIKRINGQHTDAVHPISIHDENIDPLVRFHTTRTARHIVEVKQRVLPNRFLLVCIGSSFIAPSAEYSVYLLYSTSNMPRI